jgi:hypothetical protein
MCSFVAKTLLVQWLSAYFYAVLLGVAFWQLSRCSADEKLLTGLRAGPYSVAGWEKVG